MLSNNHKYFYLFGYLLRWKRDTMVTLVIIHQKNHIEPCIGFVVNVTLAPYQYDTNNFWFLCERGFLCGVLISNMKEVHTVCVLVKSSYVDAKAILEFIQKYRTNLNHFKYTLIYATILFTTLFFLLTAIIGSTFLP